MKYLLMGVFVILSACAGVQTAEQPDGEGAASGFEAKVDVRRRIEGLLTAYADDDAGTLLLELPAPDDDGVIGEYIYVESLRGGLGSNPIGLDRGQLGESRLISVRLMGGKVLFEQQNLAFRAESDDPNEQRAVRESFASSVLWAAPVEARADDGRVLVDFTSFVMRDAHGIARRLRSGGHGSYSVDRDRSVVDTAACLAFPDNMEFEAVLTFSGSDPGFEVRRTAPEATSVTMTVHHSIVRLPDDGYRTREADPRMPSFSVSYLDYAAALDEPVRRRLVVRHRLERRDPDGASSPAVEPIVYYVDAGAPEPIRTALVEGASWWAAAFEAAGFEDAFQVEVMPEGAHPLDVRYNVIQWVHRSTRGWSYGSSVVDPRTGEILKGHVSLGSLRVRQDRLIFEGLAGTDMTGTGAPDDPVELALARIRQLSAHEVGHTLGFAHNFAASTQDRASVMDYPAPLVRVDDDGELDFSQVYDVGIGAWDVQGVRYAYTEFADASAEVDGLAAIVEESQARGDLYLSDADARPTGGAHPAAALWDNGADPVNALMGTMGVRQIAMQRFGDDNIMEGRPRSELQDVFVPLYLHHRYQLEAAAKVVGGVWYAYSLRGDAVGEAEAVPGDDQRMALSVMLMALEPRALEVPAGARAVLVPQTFGRTRGEELFDGGTDPVFDPVGAGGVVADIVFTQLLNSSRCARLIEQLRLDGEQMGLEEMLDTISATVFKADADPAMAALRRQVQRVYLEHLIGLAQRASTPSRVRAGVNSQLRTLVIALEVQEDSHAIELVSIARRHLDRPFEPGVPTRAADPTPPGSPIGVEDWCSHGAGLH